MEIILALLLGVGLLSFVFDPQDDSDPDDRGAVDEPDEAENILPPATDGDDTFILTDDADTFSARGGNDSIDGRDGDDTLFGDDGDDIIEGGRLYDDLYGGRGADTLYGGFGEDLLNGGDDNDDLQGGAGNDSLFGGNGEDLLSGGNDSDNLQGGAGDDGLFGGDGEDLLSGGAGDDFILGGDNLAGPTDESDEAFDSLYGGAGDDILIGGTGEDLLSGGAGDDVLVGSDVLRLEINEEVLRAIARDPDAELPALDSKGFKPESGINYDSLTGGDGDDILILGGYDEADGGAGDDTFVVGDYIAEGTATQISNFDSTEDVIAVAIEDGNAPAEITTTMSEDGSNASIFVDGVLVARVTGSFDANDGIDVNIVTFAYTNS